MAARYWVNGGTGNWNSTTNWSATSGGASGATVPGTSDDVTFDGAGNSASLMTAGYTINSLTVTSGYTSTLTFTTTTVNVNGNVSLGSAMTLTGTGTLRVGYVTNTSVTLNTNGTTIGCNLTIGHASGSIGVTVTLSSNVTVTGTLSLGQGSSTGDVVINSNTITANGNLVANGSSTARITRGTTTITIGGSATQTYSTTVQGVIRNSITVNKSGGSLTISDIWFDTGTFTYVAGTVTVTGTLTMLASTTFNTSGISWNNVTCNGVSSLTLTSTFTVLGNFAQTTAGTLTITGTGFFTAIGGNFTFTSNGTVFNPANNMTVGGTLTAIGSTLNTYTLSVGGGLTLTNTLVGTGAVILNGTGTWSGSNAISVDLTINTSGTITISGTVVFGASGKTLTYTAGTVNSSGGALRLTTCNINVSGVTWSSVILNTSNPTVTLLSNLNATTLTATNVGPIFNGVSYTVNLSNLDLTALTTTTISGTAKIVMTGTGTVSGGNTTGGIAIAYQQNTSGTITYSGAIRFTGANTFTHTQGTTLGGSSTVTFSGTMAINATGLTFNILELDGNATFTSTGSFGWTSSTFQSVTGTHTYKAGATYTINTLLQLIGTSASRIVMLSSVGGSMTYFNLSPTGSMTVGYVTSTDIDSSGGITIWDWQGILSNTVNWNVLSAPTTISYTFFV